ncbi:hypothetical protein P7K49_019296 [Saguinus oedipus]|uniref:Uncharacterized protein n=1 Tax=Saguinus oedipus TaxID=9490 RepID=A0ABQ9UX20_SAGOE|nr:hypothetical protein P7K49_019296 [Saguinus oedipus]
MLRRPSAGSGLRSRLRLRRGLLTSGAQLGSEGPAAGTSAHAPRDKILDRGWQLPDPGPRPTRTSSSCLPPTSAWGPEAAAGLDAAGEDPGAGRGAGLTFGYVLVNGPLDLRKAPLEVVAVRGAAAASDSCKQNGAIRPAAAPAGPRRSLTCHGSRQRDGRGPRQTREKASAPLQPSAQPQPALPPPTPSPRGRDFGGTRGLPGGAHCAGASRPRLWTQRSSASSLALGLPQWSGTSSAPTLWNSGRTSAAAVDGRKALLDRKRPQSALTNGSVGFLRNGQWRARLAAVGGASHRT